MSRWSQTQTILRSLHCAYPLVIFSYYLVSLTIAVCTLQTLRIRERDTKIRRNLILGLIFAAVITYVRRS